MIKKLGTKNILEIGKTNNDYWKIACAIHSKTIHYVVFKDGITWDDLDDKTKEEISFHTIKKPWWKFWS